MIRNSIHFVMTPIKAQSSAPKITDHMKIGFLKPLLSVTVPRIGPSIATISVEIETAYPQ